MHAHATPHRLIVLLAVIALALAAPAVAAAGKNDRGGHGQANGKHHGHATKHGDRHGKRHHAKRHGHARHHGHKGYGHKGHGHGHGPGRADHSVDVMTRNLYLGADLTPAIGAPSLEAFVAATGQIMREVTANDFPTRARGLAAEILSKRPDLVGLQEVALWRTGPPDLTPVQTGQPTATTVRVDYLRSLLDRLNRGPGTNYRVVVVQEEFDLEAPGDENGIAGDGPNPAIANAEINGRLTMRDVILARVGSGVTTRNPTSGNFRTLLPVPILGQELAIKRGWTATDARVKNSGWFRFVNTHLEAFDPAALVPSIRALQAMELVAPTGPATSDLSVILVGDLNSDDDTVAPGDRQAFEALVAAGMVNRSTGDPLSCCIDSSLLAVGSGGSIADFDHQVDQILTRDPDEVRLRFSAVTGLEPVNGFWSSDHAGVFSSLKLR